MPIEWRRPDPKTIELYNTDRGPRAYDYASQFGIVPQPNDLSIQQKMMLSQMMGDVTGRSWSEMERADMRQAVTSEREQRKMVRGFLKNLRTAGDSDMDTNQSIQDMIDTGALRYDEDGLYVTPKMHASRGQTEALVGAADKWADAVGLWKDGQFNRDNYRPYNDEQRRQQ